MEAMTPKGGLYSAYFLTGYIDDDGVHHSEYTVQEMTGEEEDILSGGGSIMSRLGRVIGNCLVKVGTIEDKNEIRKIASNLTTVDRLEAMIGIRIASLGKNIPLHLTCPNKDCEIEFNRSLDLVTLERRRMPEPEKRVRTDVISSGKKVKWHVMSAVDEEWSSEKSKTRKQDRPSIVLLARIEEIDGVVINRNKYADAIRTMKRLPMRDRSEIRSLFEKNEGFIDTEIEVVCPDCDTSFVSQLVFDESFFSHSETLDD